MSGVLIRVYPNRKYSIIHNPFSSSLARWGPRFSNFKIIWRYLSWIRMMTLLCPMWDIYGECRNFLQDYGSRKAFCSDRSIPWIVINVTSNVTVVNLPWLAHDEAPGPYITIPQYRFDNTKQHTHTPVTFSVGKMDDGLWNTPVWTDPKWQEPEPYKTWRSTYTVETMDLGRNPLGHKGVCVIKKSKNRLGHTILSLVTQ